MSVDLERIARNIYVMLKHNGQCPIKTADEEWTKTLLGFYSLTELAADERRWGG